MLKNIFENVQTVDFLSVCLKKCHDSGLFPSPMWEKLRRGGNGIELKGQVGFFFLISLCFMQRTYYYCVDNGRVGQDRPPSDDDSGPEWPLPNRLCAAVTGQPWGAYPGGPSPRATQRCTRDPQFPLTEPSDISRATLIEGCAFPNNCFLQGISEFVSRIQSLVYTSRYLLCIFFSEGQ